MHSCYRLLSNDKEPWSVFPKCYHMIIPLYKSKYLLNTKTFFVLQSKRKKVKKKKKELGKTYNKCFREWQEGYSKVGKQTGR